ncbi:MAG: hypothetical protein WC843_01765 [Candidatus Gracilibacteria bacterium]|jgi:hypothetical protein
MKNLKEKQLKRKKQPGSVDLVTLKMWKYSSTKAKLNWLESAFRFGKLKKW